MKKTIFTLLTCSLFCACKKNLEPVKSLLSQNIVEEANEVISPGVVFATNFGLDSSTLFCLNIADGSIQWQFKAEGIFTKSACIANDIIYVSTGAPGKLFAINIKNGKGIWKRTLSYFAFEAPAPCIDNGIVYAASNKDVYAFDAEDGNTIWHYHTKDYNNYNEIYSSPTVSNGHLYIGIKDFLYAFNASNGAVQWVHKSENIRSSPCVLNGQVYYTGTDSFLYALDAVTGIKKWQYPVGYTSQASPCSNGYDKIFTATNPEAGVTSLYAVNSIPGNKAWTYSETLSDAGNKGDPAYFDNAVYYSVTDSVFAFNAETGERKWASFIADGSNEVSHNSGVCAAPGLLFLQGMDKRLHALNSSTGRELWSFSLDGYFYSDFSPVVLLKNGTAYYPTVSGMKQ